MSQYDAFMAALDIYGPRKKVQGIRSDAVGYAGLPEGLKAEIMADLTRHIGPYYDPKKSLSMPSRRLIDVSYIWGDDLIIEKAALHVDLYEPICELINSLPHNDFVINYMSEYKATHTKIIYPYVMYPRYDVYFMQD